MNLCSFPKRLICAILVLSGLLASETMLAGIIPIKLKCISTADGLCNSSIQYIFQDSYGFMWFGTREGLNKYDGYHITVYKTSPGDPHSISDNFVRCIYEDKQKNLWIGTANGLNLFNRQKGNFTRFKHQLNAAGSISSNFINFVLEDSKNRLWIATEGGGLNLYNRQLKKFSSYRLHHNTGSNLHDNVIRCIFEDSKHRLWVATDIGLNRFDDRSHTLTGYPLTEGSVNISVVRENSDGKLWIGTGDKGLFILDNNSRLSHFVHHETDPKSLKSDGIRDIAFDNAGNAWIGCTNGGLNLLRSGDPTFYHYTDDDSYKSGSLFQRTVSALYHDRQDNLWIGTHRGGIKLYSPAARKFELYQQSKDNNSLSFNDVKAFYEDRDGSMWIGVDGGGLNRFSPQNNTFEHFRHNSFNSSSLSADAVTDINEDRFGNLLVATWGGGLNLFDRSSKKFTRLLNRPGDNTSISSNNVVKILRDRSGNIWIGTYYGGLNLYNDVTHKFSRVTHAPDAKTSFSGNNIIALTEDISGNIWIATDDGGLNCLDTRSNSFRHYFLGTETPPNLEVVFADHKGRIWVGQSGLYLYDPSEDRFQSVPNKIGLSDETIKGIIEDNHGDLWVSTLQGLIRFAPITGKGTHYNQADGLQSDEFEPNAVLKSRSGKLYFGGINGFNSFVPDSINTNRFIPPIYFTSFQIFNKTVSVTDKDSPLKTDINFAREIDLNHNQSTFSFTFAALNYAAANNNSYAYKLEGFDKQWNEIGHDRKAAYTNIGPGEYLLKVKASNNDGVWNDTPATIKIIISPPFWETTWFRLLAAITLLFIVYKIINIRRQLETDKIEKQKKEELHQLQLQFFTNISHELRTPLTLILGRLEKMVKEDARPFANTNFRSLFKNANRLMNLINELMDFRKVESAALKLKVANGNIALFVDEVADEFLVLAHEKQLTFQIKKNISFEEAWFDRQVLEKIMLNLIHNAIKYTPQGGKIWIELSDDHADVFNTRFKNGLKITQGYEAVRYLYLKVTDTGRGITKNSLQHLFERYYRVSESHLGSGIGLAFVKSLILLHKGAIHVFSEKDQGTEVIIAIPCAEQDYTPAERWDEAAGQQNVRLESVIPVLDYPSASHIPDINAFMDEVTADKVKKHILIVDDNEEMRELMRDALTLYYSIAEAGDGQKGFEKACTQFPDLIISDVMMPVTNGMDFCKMVRENIETSHIPFLLLSAKDTLDSKIEGIGSGADFYFSKPVNFSLLGLTIRNIFDQRQKLRTHYAKDHQVEVRELAHSVLDKEFIDKLLMIIEDQITDPNLDADYLASEMFMSKTKLYNKIKSITGQSIGEFIRTVRLRKAREIMLQEDTFITDVMFRVGIQTQSYFTRAFKKEFGKTPTQYIHEMRQNQS